MNCIQYSRFGAAADVLTLAQMPTPDPSPGEVLVELSYSGVNPSDVKARGGTRPGVTKPPFDAIIPHSDGAGRIAAVGDGVSAERIGQRVWIWNGQWQRPFGTCATHICLPADQAVPLPDAVSDQTGAVLGIPGLTAAQAVFGSGDVTGKTLLIQGGAGTVGLLAVQLAKWGGARVIATARDAGLDRASAAGADTVLNYTDTDLADHILAANGGAPVDRIIEVELGRNIDTDAQVIAPNGTIAVYGSALDMTPTLPFGPLLFKAATLDILLIYLLPKAEREACISRLHGALADGALSCPVAQVFPLAETAAAHEAVERGGRDGAILVEVQA
ncbi:NADPH:quinone reductase [Tateyamaria sp. ANG-S1]|uniref:NADPH:quinone reductase n=1 Tax=Tateyamaria sp. ANG-S1 TaxID=1577905 RepID=UPI00057C8AC2|nr:NADPH:quinone reductase [Tateyamaria sp. ANG-S1]KIC46240.1 zinc-binding dehydrogenase [Tateyamaria sp. ANG-S1]